MRPFALTLAGTALGLAAVLPIARAQVTDNTPAVVVERMPNPGSATGTATGSTKVRVTATGPVVGTRYGPVQVKITLDGGRLTQADAVQLPDGDARSQQISDYSGPRLNDAAIQAQDANFDAVSGASYTSEGYRRSLQAALDMARAAAQRGQSS